MTLNYIRDFSMKRLLLVTVILLLLGLILSAWLYSGGDDKARRAILPWKIELSESGATHVFDMDIGRITLKEMMLSLHKIADISVFESSNGKLSLEGFFGKTKLGMFDATLIADIDATQAELKSFIDLLNTSDRKGTPSGSWKYELTEESVQEVGAMRVWRLVYIPSANYEAVTIEKQFGEPESKESLMDGLTYWYYPKKGVAILEDPEGREIFYYVATDEFDRLKSELPKVKPEIK